MPALAFGFGLGLPLSALGTGGGAKRATTNGILIGGDSRATTSGPYTTTISGPLQGTTGHQVYARRFLKGKIDWNKSKVFGAGGITSTTFVASHLANMIAALVPGQMVMMMLGINDTITGNGVTLAQSQGNIDTIINAIIAAGGLVCWPDEYPTSNDGQSHNVGHQEGIRDYLRSKHNPARGVYIPRIWDVIATTPNGTTTKPGVLKAGDDLHLAVAGSILIGRVEAAMLAPVMPANDLTTRTVTSGGEFSGTSGTLTNGGTVGSFTGQAPAGWTAQVVAGSGGSIVSSIDSSNPFGDGHTWWWLAVTGVTGLQLSAFSGDLSSGWVAGTDYIEGTTLAAVQANSSNLIRISKSMRRQSGTYLLTTDAVAEFDGAAASSTADVFSTDAIEPMLLRDQHVLYPAVATFLRHFLEIYSKTGVAATFTVGFALPQLSKYVGALTD